MLESADSEDPRIIRREIIFEYSNLCDHCTSASQTDGRTTCRGRTALCLASRGNEMTNWEVIDAFNN